MVIADQSRQRPVERERDSGAHAAAKSPIGAHVEAPENAKMYVVQRDCHLVCHMALGFSNIAILYPFFISHSLLSPYIYNFSRYLYNSFRIPQNSF